MDQSVPPDGSDGQEPSFDEFIGRLKEREDSAWAALVGRYWPGLLARVRRRLKGAPMTPAFGAEDVVAESFEEAYLSCDRLHAASWGELGSWLAGIVRNVMSNLLRGECACKRDCRRVVDESVSQIPVAKREKSPSSVVADREMAELAAAELTTLSLQIAKRRAEDDPWKTIARDLQISPDAARMRLNRKREQLLAKSVFEDYRQPPGDDSSSDHLEDRTRPKPR